MGVALLSQVSPPSSDPSARHLLLDKFEVKSLNFVLIDLSPLARTTALPGPRLPQLPATPKLACHCDPSTSSPQCQVAYTTPRHLVPLYRATLRPFLHRAAPPIDPPAVICSLFRTRLRLSAR